MDVDVATGLNLDLSGWVYKLAGERQMDVNMRVLYLFSFTLMLTHNQPSIPALTLTPNDIDPTLC